MLLPLITTATILTTYITLTSALTIPSLLSSLHLTNLTADPNHPPNCHPPSKSIPKLCTDDCLDALLIFSLSHPLPSYTLTHSRSASSDTIQCPHVSAYGSCQLRIDYGKGEGQVVKVRVLEPRVLELVDKCVDGGKGWGWGGMTEGIDDGGDAVLSIEETDEGRKGGLGPGTCNKAPVKGNGTAVGDVALTARDDAVLD